MRKNSGLAVVYSPKKLFLKSLLYAHGAEQSLSIWAQVALLSHFIQVVTEFLSTGFHSRLTAVVGDLCTVYTGLTTRATT
jgi:hypothetical protein